MSNSTTAFARSDAARSEQSQRATHSLDLTNSTANAALSEKNNTLANQAKSLLVKITPPQSRRLLTRPRLLSYLEEGRQSYPVTILSANTGFGKTTALVDFGRASGSPLAWYSLDEEDKDPAVFCRYLLDAIRLLYPDFGSSFEELLRYNLQQLHQDQALVARMADEFIVGLEELLANLRNNDQPSPSAVPAPDAGLTYLKPATSSLADEAARLILVLDDYQFADCPALNKFVERLIWRMPFGFHLIIASRMMPLELPIAQMLSKQMLLTIDAKDLAFTADEINELLRRFYAVDEPQIGEALAAYSEGWVTAVILALNNKELLRNRGANWRPGEADSEGGLNAAAPIDFEQLFTFLAEEVFESQPPDLQDFLLRTSVLALLNPVGCDRLLALDSAPGSSQATDSEAWLRQIEQRNLFVSRRAGGAKGAPQTAPGRTEEVVWQYHALFHQFLRQRLRAQHSKDGLYQKLKLAAARWEQENDNFVEAIQHFVEAGQPGEAAALLSRMADALYESGRVSLLASLLTLIVGDSQSALLQTHPELLSVQARLYFEAGNHEAALRTYQLAAQSYQKKHSLEYEAYMSVLQAELLLRMGERDEAATICNWTLRDKGRLLDTYVGKQAIALANRVLGTISIEQAKNEEAEKYLKEAAELYKLLNDAFRQALIDYSFGELYHTQGRLVRSNVHFQRALNYFTRAGNRIREGYAKTGLAINCYLQGNYQLAEQQLEDTLKLITTESVPDRYVQLYLMHYLGNVYRETGRYVKAEHIYNEALSLARDSRVRRLELLILNEMALNFILVGHPDEARQLIQLSLNLAEEYRLPERVGYSYLVQGWLFFENKAYKRALSAFEGAAGSFKANQSLLEQARARLGSAVVQLAASEPRRALIALVESFDLTDELGFEPFISSELVWATSLFEYAARNTRKLSEPTLDFLRKRGFLNVAQADSPALIGSEDEPEDAPEPTAGRPESNKAQPSRKGNLRVLPPPSQLDNQPALPDSQGAVRAQLYLLKVLALDGSRVFLKSYEIEQWQRNKAREMLFYLLENERCTKDQLVEALWPDDDTADSNVFHVTMGRLRKLLVPIEIKMVSGRYFIEGAVWYDAREFAQRVSRLLALSDFSEAEAVQLSTALALYKRDFLDQIYSNWSQERQQQLLSLYLRGLMKLARFYQGQGQFQLALPLWKQYLVKDAYDEEVHRACISCLLEMGNKSEARLQSLQCVKALEELDLQPSAETLTLLRKLA